MIYLGVGVAGAMGAMLRYAVGRAFLAAGWLAIPYATLLVNVVGSFLIGFLVFALQDKWGMSENIKTMVVTGFLGGFTTFSAFSLETVTILEQGELVKGLLYIFLTLVLCLVGCAAGMLLARNI